VQRASSFDQYATTYDAALNDGLSVSGENKDYFASGRVAWLKRCLSEQGGSRRSILDFGCGTGSTMPFFFHGLGVEQATGVDVSPELIQVARRSHASDSTQFHHIDEYVPDASIDIVYCNGVFHHIPPKGRAEAVQYMFDILRPKGYLSFWENNPWNPGTRYIMSRIPFDRDAQTLSFLEASRILREGGFQPLRTDFLFIFPHSLRLLRFLETSVSRLPFGAQYQILCKKPDLG
jgi:SAM-dependent methyltransferase